MKEENVDQKKDILVRINRIEGQVKGIGKMVDKGSCCKDVLVQIAAVRAAINKVGALILENYATDCMINTMEEGNSKEKIEDLISTLTMFLK